MENWSGLPAAQIPGKGKVFHLFWLAHRECLVILIAQVHYQRLNQTKATNWPSTNGSRGKNKGQGHQKRSGRTNVSKLKFQIPGRLASFGTVLFSFSK